MSSNSLLNKLVVNLKEAGALVGVSHHWLRQAIIFQERDHPGSIQPPHPFKARGKGGIWKAKTDEFIRWYESWNEKNPPKPRLGLKPGSRRKTFPIFRQVSEAEYLEAVKRGAPTQTFWVEEEGRLLRRRIYLVNTGKRTRSKPLLLTA